MKLFGSHNNHVQTLDELDRESRLGVKDWIITIICTVIAVVLIRTFVGEVYLVPSGSMLQTVHEQDRLLGEKISYHFRTPQKGDVITFNDPSGTGHTLLKRVIATEGQTVDLRDGKVVVDGKELQEPYTSGKPSEPIENQGIGPNGRISYPFVVPKGQLWVMGDNRTNSLDSRYFGAVPISQVSSHAVWTIWPPASWKTL